MIYLDSAATTAVSEEVLEAMLPFFSQRFGNPGGLYRFGRDAMLAVENARAQVAQLFNCDPGNLVFTSGGSEGNNLAIRGAVDYLKQEGKTHILVSAVEHDSVLKSAESLIKCGFYVEKIPVTKGCFVDVVDVEKMIREDTGLISVMYVNNETGSVNPVSDIGALCLKHGILFHTDCVQAAGTHQIDVQKIGCDFATISGHKIHAPKGIGALFVKNLSKIRPLIYGGQAQEFGLRGGTENVPGIVALGKACELLNGKIHDTCTVVSALKQVFYMQLMDSLREYQLDHLIQINGMPVVTPGKTLNLRMEGVDAESLILMLDHSGVCVSAGSACASHEATPSHVLTAMGLTPDEARSSIRVSFSTMNAAEEVTEAATVIADCIRILAHST